MARDSSSTGRSRKASFSMEFHADTPAYVISVAAELTGLHPQTLRTYDRLGLVSPGRSGGGGRRYSMRDIETLRQIMQLTSEGIGLEGVRRILELEAQVDGLRDELERLRAELAEARGLLESSPYLPVPRNQASSAVVVWKGRRSRRRSSPPD